MVFCYDEPSMLFFCTSADARIRLDFYTLAKRKPQPQRPDLYEPRHNGTSGQDFSRRQKQSRENDGQLDTPPSLDDVKIAEWIRKRTDKDL